MEASPCGVQLHRGADDVGDLVEAAVVHLPERVEHAALDGLQAVVHVRHGAVEDHVAGVVEEPVPVMLGQGRLVVLDLLALLALGRSLGRLTRGDPGLRVTGDDGGGRGRRTGLGLRALGFGGGGLGAGVERQLGLVVGGFLAFGHLGEGKYQVTGSR